MGIISAMTKYKFLVSFQTFINSFNIKIYNKNRKYEGHDKKLDLQFSEEENHFPACGCKSAATLNNQKNKQHMLVCAPHKLLLQT